MKSIYYILFSLILSISVFLPVHNLNAQEDNRKILNNQEKIISIYPVPARNSAHIRLSPALKQDVDKLEIINLIGKKIAEQTIIDKNASEIIFTNLNQVPKGIYIVISRDKFGKILQSAKMVIDN